MPLGQVSNEDFESEVKNSSNQRLERPVSNVNVPDMAPVVEGEVVTSDVLIKKHHPHGRNEGDVNVPQSLRKLIGDTANMEGRQSALHLANEFGISSSSASSYTNPNNSALSESNKVDISSFLTNRKNKISKRAINKLNLAISMINEDKLKESSARDLSTIAKDMAQVVKHMEPDKEQTSEVSPVQFVMFAPQVRNENHYEVVTAKDNY